MAKASLDTLPDALSARDISKVLGLGYTKSLRLIRFGGLPYIKLGNTYRVSKQNFIDWLNSSETKIIELD